MHGYDEGKLIDIETIKNEFFYNTALTKAKKDFLDTKKKFKKGIKIFFPKKFKEFISEEQKNILLNAMNLYNSRNKIIGLFENKAISHSMYAYDAKSDRVEESERKFDESIGERVKLRRQKAGNKTDEILRRY